MGVGERVGVLVGVWVGVFVGMRVSVAVERESVELLKGLTLMSRYPAARSIKMPRILTQMGFFFAFLA